MQGRSRTEFEIQGIWKFLKVFEKKFIDWQKN